MGINWILRLKNKPVLVALVGTLIAFVYQVCGIIGVVPAISEQTIVEWAGLIINVLVFLGVVVDPSTAGVKDTSNVLERKTPRVEEAVNVNEQII